MITTQDGIELNLSNESELREYFDKRSIQRANYYVCTEAGPDMTFTGLQLQHMPVNSVEYPNYAIFLTDKLNVVLAKYCHTAKAGEYLGYSVVGKDLPDGIIKFFGTDRTAKAFYRHCDILWSVEV